jgi:hypothetical protein
MALTVYCSPDGRVVVVPACLLPCMEAQAMFGELHPDKSILTDDDSVPFHILRAIHIHGFAEITRSDLTQLQHW